LSGIALTVAESVGTIAFDREAGIRYLHEPALIRQMRASWRRPEHERVRQVVVAIDRHNSMMRQADTASCYPLPKKQAKSTVLASSGAGHKSARCRRVQQAAPAPVNAGSV
jgi:hypothetical protein